MELLNKKKLVKLQKKNKGNKKLVDAIKQLISDIEGEDIDGYEKLQEVRQDADKVHNDGLYFFDIHVHRTLILIEMDEDLSEATVVWVGNHDEYERTFKNNKSTIHKWLRNNDWIA